METPEIWFMGDVHGEFGYIAPLLRTAIKQGACPAALVYLGDLGMQEPLEACVKDLHAFGVEMWFIHGNHDNDNDVFFHNLFDSPLFQQRNLHGRVVEVAGIRIGGLGGVFDEKIWHPGKNNGNALFPSFAEYAKTQKDTSDPAVPGRLRKYCGSIFPDVFNPLSLMSADVLVTHEAPSCHEHGHVFIDDLAQSMEVKYLFHGHQHDRLDYRNDWERLGFKAFGVGKRGITNLRGDVIRVGELDEARQELFNKGATQAW